MKEFMLTIAVTLASCVTTSEKAASPNEASVCPDLSHIAIVDFSKIEIRYTQVGCEKFVAQTYSQGKPSGKPWDVLFGPDWQAQTIEHEFDDTTSKHRWFWSHDRQKLIHEGLIESHFKAQDSWEWSSGSRVYSLVADKIQSTYVNLRRVEESGEVKLTSDRKEESFTRINR